MDEANEITSELLEHLLTFSIFLIFLEILKKLKTHQWLRYLIFKVEDNHFLKDSEPNTDKT